MEGGHAAVRPLEALLGVSEIAHDVAVLPTTLLGAWTTQITGRR